MTKLIFRSGLRSIGGTIIELIKEDKRLIFDFGTVFSPGQEDKLPNVKGIYDNTSKYDDMVLISHLHLDHTKAMNLVHKDIPVVLNEKSKEFLEDLYTMGKDIFMGEKREYKSVKANESFYHGEFKITNMLVDHDVLGAGCFYIQTEDLNLLYTGDLRLHGLHSNRTYEMIEYLKTQDVDVAIFECVMVSFIDDDYKIIPTNEVNELDMEINFHKLVEKTIKEEGILFNPYIMGIERLYSLFDLAKKRNKEVWLTNDFAFLANKYYPEFDFKILESDDFNLNKDIVHFKDINKDVIAIFDYDKRDYYQDLSGFALLQTGGEPLGDFDPRWEDLVKYCDDKKINLYKIGSGGHAFVENLIYILEQINPHIVMPLHSFKPELVKSDKVKQIMVKEDKEYIFDKHKLK